MGLFDRFKKQSQQPKQSVQAHRGMYSMPTLDGDELILFNLEKLNSIRHGNNELTDLMMARVVKQKGNDTIYVDTADYIGFEVPYGMEVNDDIIQEVMTHYYQSGNEYIGCLMSDSKGYTFARRSEAVRNILSKTIEQREEQRRDFVEQRKKEYQQTQENRRAQFLASIDQRNHLEVFEEERNRRKQSPTLKRVYVQGESTYSNYNGVNLETGDILKIRQVDKIGKDGNGTYLYSAYIYNTPNEHDAEMFGETPMGVAVCFELQKRLEDIVDRGNINEITQVLQLLSDGRNFENSKQLNYVGGIDKNGQVNRKAISSSSSIQATIVKMQRQFAEKMKQQGREIY